MQIELEDSCVARVGEKILWRHLAAIFVNSFQRKSWEMDYEIVCLRFSSLTKLVGNVTEIKYWAPFPLYIRVTSLSKSLNNVLQKKST